MNKYLILSCYTQESDGDHADPSLNIVGVTDDFNKIREIAEEDLNEFATEYADSMDADEDTAEEYINDYVSDAEYRTTLKEEDLEPNVLTLFLTNFFEMSCDYEDLKYYVVKVEA